MITLTDVCRADVRRALQADPGVLLVGRSASPSGAQTIDRCLWGVYIAAEHLATREGVDVRHLLPPWQVLAEHHRAAAVVERTQTADGGTVTHRWSVWTPPSAKALTVLLSTGSARAV